MPFLHVKCYLGPLPPLQCWLIEEHIRVNSSMKYQQLPTWQWRGRGSQLEISSKEQSLTFVYDSSSSFLFYRLFWNSCYKEERATECSMCVQYLLNLHALGSSQPRQLKKSSCVLLHGVTNRIGQFSEPNFV